MAIRGLYSEKGPQESDATEEDEETGSSEEVKVQGEDKCQPRYRPRAGGRLVRGRARLEPRALAARSLNVQHVIRFGTRLRSPGSCVALLSRSSIGVRLLATVGRPQ
jgi:hypothetical protein